LALAVCVLMLFTLSACGEQKTYDRANQLFAEGKYANALEMYESISGYKDSESKISECRINIDIASDYERAVAEMDRGNYIEAANVFESLKDYKDSKQKVAECKYNHAIYLINAGKNTEAEEILKTLTEYTDTLEGYQDTLSQLKAGMLKDYIDKNGVEKKEIDKEIFQDTSLQNVEMRCLTGDYEDRDGNAYTLLAVSTADNQLMFYYYQTSSKKVDKIGDVNYVNEFIVPVTKNTEDAPFAVERSYVIKDKKKLYLTLYMCNLWNEGKEYDPSYNMATVNSNTEWIVTDFTDKASKNKIYYSGSKEVQKVSGDFSKGVAEIIRHADDLISGSDITLYDIGFKSV
jgi:tetratricopeptide (TPR) repeat protein